MARGLWLWLVVPALALTACPKGTGTTVDGGTPSNTDAGGVDAGAPDAGDVDAGRPDAGATDGGTPDGGDLDAGVPDGGDADAGSEAALHPRFVPTGGGGEAASADYRVRLSVGAPVPSGDAAGASDRVHVGDTPAP